VGIAGPVSHHIAEPTNIDWWLKINMDDIINDFGFEHGVFLNDFEANAYGLLETKKNTYYNIITGAKRTPMERMYIVGAGTGLGNCLLIPKPNKLEISELDLTTDYLIPP